ncbi:cysteine hydrolase family protein [Pseudoduganella namucuonensis]|uniref:Ureidoacrylate peracid hydrolase n=1 Tax=Pseudoduganella namucuonensis TaxID=1035707 RepID=A0A1I7IMB8_9BURK|nr:isochorismatase family cysteine hydrolase [Pseudoduganella namucuonensis]SFU74024.1 ureidoacrylate peracid hydrolase [Pseudoduganella namucuonensis]
MTPSPLDDLLAPGGVALCVIDIQVDFAAPDGALARMGVPVEQAAAAIGNAARLVSAARGAGVPIFFAGLKTDPTTDSAAWIKWMRYRNVDPDAAYAVCRDGSGGECFYQVLPQGCDKIVWKQRYSAFVGTDFDSRLRDLRVDTLVICGLSTECCVDSTVRDAFQRDWLVVVAGDACAAYRDDFHVHTLEVLAENFAAILDTDEIVAQWERQTIKG